MAKNEYTDLVLGEVVRVMEGVQGETFRELISACEATGKDGQSEEMEVETEAEGMEIEDDMVLRRTGWGRPVPVWVPR